MINFVLQLWTFYSFSDKWGFHYKRVHILYLSGWNESCANKNNESEKAFVKTKVYNWCQNKDYV